ncbi:MAG: hypothetical protein GY828_03755, partial [Candidatus Gracilibacteria bacterium]|nr:hypothetical protein [Candidatus Gracilibacteria bacterium]
LKESLEKSISFQKYVIFENYIIFYYGGKPNDEDFFHNIIVFEVDREITEEEEQCISLLSLNFNNCFQNMIYKKEIQGAQEEIVTLLGESVENRSK